MTKIKKLVVEMYILVNQMVRITVSTMLIGAKNADVLEMKIENLQRILGNIRAIVVQDLFDSTNDLEKILGEKADVDAIAEDCLPELPYELIRNVINTFPVELYIGVRSQLLYPVISISEEEEGTCWTAKYEYEMEKKNFRLVVIADSSRKLVKEIRDASEKEYRL